MTDYALDVQGLSKTFAGTKALDDVELRLAPGEVHGLLGQNGSGKSTLIKVLAGFHPPDAGYSVRAAGQELSLPLHDTDLRRLGWAFVHQDLGLLRELRVIDNMHLAGLGSFRRRAIRWRQDRAYLRELFASYGLDLSPDAIVGNLSGADRAMVAIARAAEVIRGRNERAPGGLLILDEPTVYLPQAEVERLFTLVRQVAGHGVSVLFVSHMLDEVRSITDRLTVLRDGRVTAQARTEELSDAEVVQAIVGRAVIPPTRGTMAGRLDQAPALSITGLRSSRLRGVDLQVHKGEVLGVTGLAGSGFEDVPYLIFGAQPAAAGQLELHGRTIPIRRIRPHRAIADGIAFIPGNRLTQGAAGEQTVALNLTLNTLGSHTIGPMLSRRSERRRVCELITQYDVRPADPDRPFGQLSGGNQQKALLAKWLQDAPSVLLLHEPTQGLDVAARKQVVETVRALAGAGAAVICASSDFEQIEQLCDHAMVFRRGRVRTELRADQVTQQRLAEESFRSEEESDD